MKLSSKIKYPVLPENEQINLFLQYQILVNELKQQGRSLTAKNIKWLQREYPDKKGLIKLALEAREKLILCNEGMIVNLASQYARNNSISVEDLIQVGREACIYALTKYSPEPQKKGRKRTKFSSYAQIWIRSKIASAVKKSGDIPVPDYAKKAGIQYHFISHEFLSEKSPSVYDRLIVEDDIDPLSFLSDQEIEILSHHYSFSKKQSNTLDLWGDGNQINKIIEKIKQHAQVC